MKGAQAEFEKSFGSGTGTLENMSAMADTMSQMAGVLSSDGTDGFMADAYSASEMMSTCSNCTANTLAGVDPQNRHTIRVNVGHKKFGTDFALTRTLSHESGHSVGLRDQAVNGVGAYNDGVQAERDAYDLLPKVSPDRALKNPDTITEYAK